MGRILWFYGRAGTARVQTGAVSTRYTVQCSRQQRCVCTSTTLHSQCTDEPPHSAQSPPTPICCFTTCFTTETSRTTNRQQVVQQVHAHVDCSPKQVHNTLGSRLNLTTCCRRTSTTPILGCRKIVGQFSFCCKIFVQNATFGTENPHFGGNLGDKIDIFSTHNLLCQKIANYCPRNFVNARRRCTRH